MKLSEKPKSSASDKASKCFQKFCVLKVVFVVICGVIVYSWKAEVPKPTPVIMTLDGPVQGNIRYSRDGLEYWEFLGIPYAKPPVEELLFQPPVPVEPWKNVKQVTKYNQGCWQFDLMFTVKPIGEADCLDVNVFTNVANGNGSKPVLAYIFGGAFALGGSNFYQPDFFMDYDVVLVVMNYRVGPYGFLNLQDENSENNNLPQGNMGLKDQQLALKWIQRNIANFGGDPKRVTLFGESAGAVSTHLHIMSPVSNGLFHRAILQSGSALSPYTISGNPKHIAAEYAKRIKCPVTNTTEALLNCFKSVKWQDLVNKQVSIMEPLKTKDLFEPTIDGVFLTDKPENILKSGKFPKMPIMIGMNSGEGVVRSARFEAMPELIPELDKNWADLLHNLFMLDDPIPPEVSMAIRKTYFGDAKFSENFGGFMLNLTQAGSDGAFYYPGLRSAVYHARNGAPTYMYYYNYTSHTFPGLCSIYGANRLDDWLPGKLKIFWSMGRDWVTQYIFNLPGSRIYGIGHGEGLFQLWNLLGITKYTAAKDSDFSHSFLKLIVDFANDTTSLTFRDVSWPPINKHLNSGGDEYTIPFMLMDNEKVPRIIPAPFKGRLRFWADIVNKIQEKNEM